MTALDPAWNDLGSRPIPGAAPVGGDARYEPEYEVVEGEIGKLQTKPAEVDWNAIAEAAAFILGNKSKDLQTAGRLTCALFVLHGFEGLATGLGVLRDLMAGDHWQDLYPPVRRVRARVAVLEWVAERVTRGLEKTDPPTAADAQLLASSVESLGTIDSRAGELLGDKAPPLFELKRALQGFSDEATHLKQEEERRAEEQRAEEARKQTQDDARAGQVSEAGTAETPGVAAGAVSAAPQAEARVPASPAAAPTPELAAVDTADLSKAFRALRGNLINVATTLRRQKLADPRAYSLLRNAVWMEIERLPPNRNGRTELPELPPLERKKYFEQLQQDGDFPTLIHEVEGTLSNLPFWLDGHRLVANALESLGGENLKARNAVVDALNWLLRRFTGIERLQFMTGVGFADDLTLTWIESEVAADSAAQPGSGAGGEPQPWRAAADEARQLLVKGKVADGLSLFRAGLTMVAGERERFCWELEQARACLSAGFTDVAAVQLEHLEERVERYDLEKWEPALALDVAGLYLMCNKGKLAGDAARIPEKAAKIARAKTRLCRLDVPAALEYGKE